VFVFVGVCLFLWVFVFACVFVFYFCTVFVSLQCILFLCFLVFDGWPFVSVVRVCKFMCVVCMCTCLGDFLWFKLCV